MESSSSPLDRAASIPLLRRLLAADALRSGEVKRMEGRLRREMPWRLWLDRGLLMAGIILIAAGIGYFFAHNWQHLTENDKLGLAGGSVLAAFAGAIYAGAHRFAGKWLLLTASLLVGVFIAVFGQIYQTGADTFELFRAWALLVLPWAALGQFMPLWLFWLALVNLTIGFYWPVSFYLISGSQNAEVCFQLETLSLFALNLAALSLREWAGWARIAWIDRGWSALVLVGAVLVPETAETVYEVLRTWDSHSDLSFAPAVVAFYSGVVVVVAYYYGTVRPSLPALALGAFSVCGVLTVLAARAVFPDGAGSPWAGQWLVMGILVLAIFGIGVLFLRWASGVIPKFL
jgi:uncharacterized membrane protein